MRKKVEPDLDTFEVVCIFGNCTFLMCTDVPPKFLLASDHSIFYDEMVVIFFMNYIAKSYVKRLTDQERELFGPTCS